MRKTLSDVARYLKEIMVPETEEAYAIDPAYTAVSTEENIRAGVRALRGFLARLYDALIAGGDAYDNSKKVAHAYENRTSLSVYYPFLHNVGTLLINIGYHGVLAGGAQSIACDDRLFNKKLSVPKNLECLRFLMACGIRVEGIDVNDRKQSLADNHAIRIAYPDDPAMLIGLKALSIAEVDHRNLDNQDVLLRCDHRALKTEATDAVSIVRDMIRPLPADIQAFVLQLHQRYLDQGLSCVVETKGFHTYVKYGYRRKDVWGLNASLSNGYHINVKAVKTDEYADAIQSFPPALQDLIAKGYGCGRKRDIGRCDGGCRGMPIPLDDAALGMREDIVTWFDLEVACLQRR